MKEMQNIPALQPLAINANDLVSGLNINSSLPDQQQAKLAVQEVVNAHKDLLATEKEEFEISFLLAGQKTIRKKRYLIPSTNDPKRVLELDIFNDIDLMVVEYETEDETLTDTLVKENWFGEEVTEDLSYTNIQLAYNKLK
jgi:CYTH domain-containing protein